MSQKMKEQLDAMLAAPVQGGEGAPEGTPPSGQPEPVQLPSGEPPVDGDEPALDGAPSIDGEPTPQADPRDAVIAQMQEQMRLMQEKMAFTEGQLSQISQTSPAAPAAAPQQIPSYFTPDEVKAIAEDGLDGSQMVDLMNKAIHRGVSSGMQAVQAQMPQTVGGIVDRKVTESQAISSFYAKNTDLVDSAQLVGMLAQKIAGDDPKLSLPQVLDKTAKEARKLLKLPELSPDKPAPSRVPAKPSGQPSGAGGRQGGVQTPQGTPVKSKMQEQIDQLFTPA